MELWVWGRTVDYEDAAPLPTACGLVQWGAQAEMVRRVALASEHHDWGVSPLWV